MEVVVVGLNHKSAPIEVRERLSVHKAHLPYFLQELRLAGVEETAVLSTCNRFEIYAGGCESVETLNRVGRVLSERSSLPDDRLQTCLYSMTEPHSVRHLFKVASGLDSMVLGEHEIVRQVKDAYECARAEGFTGKLLNALFQKALNTAKAVRTQTEIGHIHASVGSVAVELAGKVFGNLSKRCVVLVGAGEAAEGILKRLSDREAVDVRIVNRSTERAVKLAMQYGGSAYGLDRLAEQLLCAEIVICSAGSDTAFIGSALVDKAMRERRQNPLCFIDLGVPRNVAVGVGDIENVYLFNIDDLERLRTKSDEIYHKAIDASNQIIERKVEYFMQSWKQELCRSA